jgi:hypothetical protein
MVAYAACGYGHYPTSTRTTNKKIHHYRCLGSDDYRYEGGRVCANKPVRADYLRAARVLERAGAASRASAHRDTSAHDRSMAVSQRRIAATMVE